MNQDQDKRTMKLLAIQTLFLGLILIGALLGLFLSFLTD